jgi:hypothetical protein
VVADRLDDDVTRFGGHEPNALLMQKLANFIPWVVVLIIKVRRADR